MHIHLHCSSLLLIGNVQINLGFTLKNNSCS